MPILGIIASSLLAAAGDFESIATVTVGSGGSSSITFSSIPSDYTHLQIRCSARASIGAGIQDWIFGEFNSDTGNNYTLHYLTGNGSTASAAGFNSLPRAYLGRTVDSVAGSNEFSGTVCDILDYKNSNKYKTTRSLGGADSNGDGEIWFFSSLWQSTSAITSIRLYTSSSANFAQYSHFALYGCKSA